MNLPAAMPEVTIDPVQIAVDSVPVFETLSAMPEIAMHDSKIDCPDVSALNPIAIQPIAMHLPELDYPSVPDISTCHPFEISMEMPEAWQMQRKRQNTSFHCSRERDMSTLSFMMWKAA